MIWKRSQLNEEKPKKTKKIISRKLSHYAQGQETDGFPQRKPGQAKKRMSSNKGNTKKCPPRGAKRKRKETTLFPPGRYLAHRLLLKKINDNSKYTMPKVPILF